MPRKNTYPEQEGRDIVTRRAGYRCEYCGKPGSDWSHRISRGRGGQWQPSNGLLLCADCHRRAHANPSWAYEEGIFVRTNATPSLVPVRYLTRYKGRRWVLLDDEGGRTETVAPC